MKSLLLYVMPILIFFCAEHAFATVSISSVRIQDDRVLLTTDQQVTIDISPTIAFDYAARKISGNSVAMLSNETLILPQEIYQNLVRIFPEAGFRTHWAERFGDFTQSNGVVSLKLITGLSYPSRSVAIPVLTKRILNCQDENFHNCLGLTVGPANPNVLTSLLHQEPIEPLESSGALIRSRSENLAIFIEAGFPEALAKWMSLALDIRTAYFLAKDTSGLERELAQMNYLDTIVQGEIRGNFPNFQVDFTLDQLDSKIKNFLSSRADEVEKLAQYVLAHFPYQSFDSEKMKLGNFGVNLGGMIRIKRKINANTNANGTGENFIVRDSIEVFVSLGLSPHSTRDELEVDTRLVKASFAVGPAYFRRYEAIRYASSQEEAKKGYWQIPKKLFVGNDITDLTTDQRVSFESGWVANLSSTISGGAATRIATIKPTANASANYRWLSRKFASRNADGSMYVGIVDGQQFDLNFQAMLRSFSKMLRLPFFSVEYLSRDELGKIYLVPKESFNLDTSKQQLQSFFDKRDSQRLGKLFPGANLDVHSKTSYRFFNWFYGSGDNSGLQLNIKLDKDINEKSWIQENKKYLVLENSKSEKSVFNLFHKPKSVNCSAWMGAELLPDIEQSNLLYRLKCFYEFADKDPLSVNDIRSQISAFVMVNDNSSLLNSFESKNGRKTVITEMELGKEILQPIFQGKVTGWVAEFAKEIELLRAPDAPLASIKVADAQERMLLYMALSTILAKKTPEERLRSFFQAVTTDGGNELMATAILRRNQQALRKIEIFAPLASDPMKFRRTPLPVIDKH